MSSPLPDIPRSLPPAAHTALGRLQYTALAVGIVALVLCAIGAVFIPGPFFRAYLASFLFYLGIAHGCFLILMMYYLTGGAWGFLIRRPLEAGMRTLPLLAMLFVPIGLGAADLYPWAQPHDGPISHEMQRRETYYLNLPFFWVRAGIGFAVWLIVAYFLSAWSRRQDETGDPRLARKLNLLAGPGLVLYGITFMFAMVDWVMSLQPAFHSSIIGPLFASGELLLGHAAALIVAAWLVRRPPLANVVSDEAIADLGNLLFSFLIIWAYMEFFQFMLIWIADLPGDVAWYLPRTDGGWYWVVWALFILHFAVPFVLLLFRAVAHSLRALPWVAGLLLIMHLVYLYVIVLPIFPETSLLQHWMDPLLPVGLGGLWLAFYLWNLQARRCCRSTTSIRRRHCISANTTWGRRLKPRRCRMHEEIRHPEGRIEHPSVRYEHTDASLKPILVILACALVLGILIHVIVWQFFAGYERRLAERASRRCRSRWRHPRPCRPSRVWNSSTACKATTLQMSTRVRRRRRISSASTARRRKPASCIFPSRRR